MREALLYNQITDSYDKIPAYHASEVLSIPYPSDATIYKKGRGKNKKEYYSDFITFDIETTTKEEPDDKYIAFMYHWQMNIFGKNIYGRYWEECINIFKEIAARPYTTICFIQNAGSAL